MKTTRVAFIGLLLAAAAMFGLANTAVAFESKSDKEAIKLEKEKTRLAKTANKQAAKAQKKLKLTEEQKAQLHSQLVDYYTTMYPVATALKNSGGDTKKQEYFSNLYAQRSERMRQSLASSLSEKQLKFFDKLAKSDLKAATPLPAYNFDDDFPATDGSDDFVQTGPDATGN